MAARLFLALLVALVAVSSVPPARADTLARTLAPFERAQWPSFLGALTLDPAKSYVVLIQIPAAFAIDLTTPETARKSFARIVMTPGALVTSKTSVGHMMVGWQCASGHGLVSKTGDRRSQAFFMAAFGGWGLTPLVSTFTDGHLVAIDNVTWRYTTRIATGSANILAVEVPETSCQSMRQRLASYIEDPRNPASRFGFLFNANGLKGDGCASFALRTIEAAGLFDGATRTFWRKIAIFDDMLGRRHDVPKDVIPYVRAKPGEKERVISFARLLAGPWGNGKIVKVVDVVDPELIFAAVTGLREMAGEKNGMWQRRALPASDPKARRAREAVGKWARKHFRTMRFVDPLGISALVLER